MKFDMQPRIVNNFITSRKKKKKSTLSRGSGRTSLKTSVWYVWYNTISFLKFWSILIDRINCTCSDEIILRHASYPAMYLIQNIKYTHTLGTSEIRKTNRTTTNIISDLFSCFLLSVTRPLNLFVFICKIYILYKRSLLHNSWSIWLLEL